MSMTIQSSVKDKILATSSETSKVENAPAEMLRDLDQQMEKRADDGKANVVTDALSRKERVKPRRVRAMAMTIQYGVRGMILAAQSEAFKQENVLLVGSVRDEAQASRYLVHLGVDVVILERIGLVAYRLRLPKELNNVHDTFHVSNLKKCLADANLHVPLDDIKVGKTLHFVKEPVEIMDREIRKLKRRKITLVKVMWNSKHGSEFTWEHEYQMRIKYPQLSVDRVVKLAS
ncbi:hypothetical protein Tco_0798973 [Tanacetum coccineum]